MSEKVVWAKFEKPDEAIVGGRTSTQEWERYTTYEVGDDGRDAVYHKEVEYAPTDGEALVAAMEARYGEAFEGKQPPVSPRLPAATAQQGDGGLDFIEAEAEAVAAIELHPSCPNFSKQRALLRERGQGLSSREVEEAVDRLYEAWEAARGAHPTYGRKEDEAPTAAAKGWKNTPPPANNPFAALAALKK